MAVYAGQLLSLKLSVGCQGQYKLELPLQQLMQLQHLQLEGITVQLPAVKDSPGSNSKGSIIQDDSSSVRSSKRKGSKCKGKKGSTSSSSLLASPELSSLQHLELASVKLANTNSLLQLAKAPQLTCLMLQDMTLADVKLCSDPKQSNPPRAVSRVARAIPGLLQQLPLLSVLQLPGFPFTDAALQQAAAMTRLQQLSIARTEDMDPSDLDHLPSSITQLRLDGNSGPDSDPDLPLEWSQLSGLLRLELYACAVYPMVLGGLTQLQHL
jgi:hypothetical protein